MGSLTVVIEVELLGRYFFAKENLGRASQQERNCPDWPPDHTTTNP